MLLDVRLLACLAALPLSGCGTLYLAQAAAGQWQVMAARRPIAAIEADPATSPQLRARLAQIVAARDFASQELGLPDNGSYRQYAAIGREYVVWNVVAAPEFSVVPREWCFPVAGCVAYRGYFSERRARDYALALETRGDDVVVGGVAAYSTLGRFADPVLSSMLAYGDEQLAAVIFHELAHQVAYVPGDSAFNEAFAMTVEQESLTRWLVARGTPEKLVVWQKRRVAQAEIATLFAARRAELRRLYATPLDAPDMRAGKRAILRALVDDLRTFEQRSGMASGYARWFDVGLNNAHLASVATYFGCMPQFRRMLRAAHDELPRFYAAVRELAAGPAAGRAALCGKPAVTPMPARLSAVESAAQCCRGAR